MEAPASLKGQLLDCPKCGSHQLVKEAVWSKIRFILILLLIFVPPLIIDYIHRNRLADIKSNVYKDAFRDGESVGKLKTYDKAYKEGYLAAVEQMQAAAQFVKIAKDERQNSPILITDKTSKKFPCKNIRFITSDNDLRIIGEITNDSNRTYDLINFRLSIYDKKDSLLDTGSFMLLNFEKNQTRSFETYLFIPWLSTDFNSYKIDFDSGIKTGIFNKNIYENEDDYPIYKSRIEPNKSQQTIPVASEIIPVYGEGTELLEKQNRKEAEKMRLTLDEYNALQRLWSSLRFVRNVKYESREFSPERLAQNNFIRGLFDVSQGNKWKPGSDAYLTREEIKGREELLAKRKRLARLQLKKENFEKLGQKEEAEKTYSQIIKILQK
jgi:hypothetical protein